MKNILVVLVSLILFSYGMQTYAGNERKNSMKSEAVRADSAIAKTNPGIKAESKANTRNLDTAKRPPDPLEKGADKQHGMENMKNNMPVDPLEKGAVKQRGMENMKNKMPPDDFGKGM
jgi:hypothetical protein